MTLDFWLTLSGLLSKTRKWNLHMHIRRQRIYHAISVNRSQKSAVRKQINSNVIPGVFLLDTLPLCHVCRATSSAIALCQGGQWHTEVFAILLQLMPNTHRRRRRDSTVELSRFGVASASAVCIGLNNTFQDCSTSLPPAVQNKFRRAPKSHLFDCPFSS